MFIKRFQKYVQIFNYVINQSTEGANTKEKILPGPTYWFLQMFKYFNRICT